MNRRHTPSKRQTKADSIKSANKKMEERFVKERAEFDTVSYGTGANNLEEEEIDEANKPQPWYPPKLRK